MKANKAPEKIYFGTQQNMTNPFSGLTQKCTDTDIEYARTDVFIEKACDFIAENMTCNGYTLQTKAKFIRDFKKYMKGE